MKNVSVKIVTNNLFVWKWHNVVVLTSEKVCLMTILWLINVNMFDVFKWFWMSFPP